MKLNKLKKLFKLYSPNNMKKKILITLASLFIGVSLGLLIYKTHNYIYTPSRYLSKIATKTPEKTIEKWETNKNNSYLVTIYTTDTDYYSRSKLKQINKLLKPYKNNKRLVIVNVPIKDKKFPKWYKNNLTLDKVTVPAINIYGIYNVENTKDNTSIKFKPIHSVALKTAKEFKNIDNQLKKMLKK